MWFNVDYNKLVVQLLPTFLRKSVLIAFIQSLIVPIDKLYYNWFIWRKENLYKLAHTGQVCYLRKALNDRFDEVHRRIIIVNGNAYERDYIYTTPELLPNMIGTMFIHSNSDYADTGVDFIVKSPANIPAMQTAEKYEMKALIDFYKEGVKRYKIEQL